MTNSNIDNIISNKGYGCKWTRKTINEEDWDKLYILLNKVNTILQRN